MKKLVLSLFAFLAFMTSYCQNAKTQQVPSLVKTEFQKIYPGVTPKWLIVDNKYNAQFRADNKKGTVVFDKYGNSSEKISLDKIPPAMKYYIDTHFSGQKFNSVEKKMTVAGDMNYFLVVANKTLHFDIEGELADEKMN